MKPLLVYLELEKLGIASFLFDQTFLAAYPLHDGEFDDFGYERSPVRRALLEMIFRDDKKTPTCMRSALHYNWARFQNIFLFSPTDAIQTYFGEEVGLYFAFITVYTIGRPNSTSGNHRPSRNPRTYQYTSRSQTERYGEIREI